MNPLPFEHDSLELLKACALALLPVQPGAAASQEPGQAQSAAVRAAGTVWQRLPGGSAVMKQADSSPASAYGRFSPEQMAEKSVGVSVEALSRAVERDARRFDKY